MKLSKADESSLVIAFTEFLQRAKILHWGYAPVGPGWEESVLDSLSEEGRKELKSKLDPSLETFVQERIFRRFFFSGNELPPDGEISLSSADGFSKPLEVAKEFVKHITSAPHNYRLALPLGSLFSGLADDDDELRVSDRLWIYKGSVIDDSHKFGHENEAMDKRLKPSGFPSAGTEDAEHYAVYHCSGIFSNRYASRHVESFYDELRAFFGALLAAGHLYTFPFQLATFEPVVFSNVITKDGPELVAVNNADSDVKSATNFIVSKELRDENADLATLIRPAVDLFTSDERNRLTTAAGWVFRANISSRPIDRALEAAIALEVLLGDRETSDRIGLSKLMANRCAYALASSQKERNTIIDRFLKFYKVRSEIVHAGRTKVSDEDKKIVTHGVALSARLLNHEIRMSSNE